MGKKNRHALRKGAGGRAQGEEEGKKRRAPIQIICYLTPRQCVHFAPIRWGMVEINTVDARIATLIVNICNVLGTRYTFLSFAPHHFCCPTGKRQGSRVNPSWVVPGLAFSTTAHPPSLLLTCASPTRSHPAFHHPVTSGTCQAGYPEAPRSWQEVKT